MIQIRKITSKDQDQVLEIVNHFWGAAFVVAHGEVFYPQNLAGLAAVEKEKILGICHYQIHDEQCEIITLACLRENCGIGARLIQAVEKAALQANGQKISLITTNDNLNALGFYQKRGFRIKKIFPDQMDVTRKIKPNLPEYGENGIPLRDEILLEKDLY